MHEDLEQQREGQWLRVIDRARVGDRSLHQGQARVRETAQRGCSRQLAAAEEAGLDAGLPDPGAVERRIDMVNAVSRCWCAASSAPR